MESPPLQALERPAWQRLIGDLIRTVGDYLLLVLWGTFGVLVLSTLVGYLPYSDRPGPGWHGVGQTASLSAVWYFLSWAGFAALYVAVVGLMLFVGARILQLIKCPRWLIRIIGALASGFLSLYVIAGVGWYIAIAALPVYAAGALGAAFGAFLLVPNSGPKIRRTRSRHWFALGAPLVILGLGAGTSYVRSLSDQQLEVVFVKWNELPQDLALDLEGGVRVPLTAEEMSRLRAAGLRGTLTVTGASTHGSGPDARMLILMKSQPTSSVTLQQPNQSAIIYVQDGDNWNRYPSDARLLDRTVELFSPSEAPTQTQYLVRLASGARSGGTAAIW